MQLDLPYAFFSGLVLGVLGGLVFLVWDLINHSLSHALLQGIQAGLVFALLGFLLGLVIGHRK